MALSSAVTAGAAAYWAKRHTSDNRLSRWNMTTSLMGIAWACLIGALWWPALFPIFVVIYAMNLPLFGATKRSLVLKGIGGDKAGVATSSIAREIVMTISRTLALMLGAVIAMAITDQTLALVVLVGLLLLFLPVEYLTARRLQNR